MAKNKIMTVNYITSAFAILPIGDNLTDYFIRYASGLMGQVTTAYPFEYESISLFVWEKNEDDWQVIEATTGTLIGDENDGYKTKDAAIKAAKKMIDRFGVETIKIKIRHAQEVYLKPKQIVCNVMEA